MFDNINVNPRKNEGFLTSIPCIPIPEYGQLNAPLIDFTLSNARRFFSSMGGVLGHLRCEWVKDGAY